MTDLLLGNFNSSDEEDERKSSGSCPNVCTVRLMAVAGNASYNALWREIMGGPSLVKQMSRQIMGRLNNCLKDEFESIEYQLIGRIFLDGATEVVFKKWTEEDIAAWKQTMVIVGEGGNTLPNPSRCRNPDVFLAVDEDVDVFYGYEWRDMLGWCGALVLH